MKSYVIHLIRHGICEGNLEGRYVGRTESPLCTEGIKELINLKSKHKYPTAIDYYASPSTRCVDSLKVLYPEVKDPTVILEMAELDFGDFENRTAGELSNNPIFTKWIAGEEGVSPPNGESYGVFMQRVCSGFEMLVKNMMFTGKNSAVLVTHAGVIMTILAAYGLPEAPMIDWQTNPGEGYSIRIDPSLWSRGNVFEVFQRLPMIDEEES